MILQTGIVNEGIPPSDLPDRSRSGSPDQVWYLDTLGAERPTVREGGVLVGIQCQMVV